MTEQVRKVLLDAADLVEKGWTRGAMAVDRHGHAVAPDSPKACRRCAYGAIYVAAGFCYELTFKACEDFRVFMLGRYSQDIVDWNDSQRSKYPVVRALRKAAEG